MFTEGGKQPAKLCFSTDCRDTKDTKRRQTIKRLLFYFILSALNKLHTLDTCRRLDWHVDRMRISFSSPTASARFFPLRFKPGCQACDSRVPLFGFKASSLAKTALCNLIPFK